MWRLGSKFFCQLILCLLFSGLAFGLETDPEYPGIGNNGHIRNIAFAQIQICVNAFYKLNGQWPDSWQAVCNEGLCEIQLRGYKLSLIDPDDGSLDMVGDVIYEYNPTSSKAVLHLAVPTGGSYSVKHFPLTPPKTYIEQFDLTDQILDDYGYVGDSYSELYASNPDKLRQFAHLHVFKQSLELFMKIKGGYPHTIAELLSSELCPLSSDTLNPVTNTKYRFDGSRDDIFYHYIQPNFCELKHVDIEAATTPGFTY